MLYCRNCGRQLKDGMRFCDRCGQSVRQKNGMDRESKQREIEALKTERLNRKKRLAEKEEKLAQSRKKRGRGKFVLIYIVAIILIAIASYIVGVHIIKQGSVTNENSRTETDAPTAVPSATPANGLSKIVESGVTCPYPTEFSTKAVSDKETLNLSDNIGGATMIIAKEATTGKISDLMQKYIGKKSTEGVQTGDDWYSVDYVSDGKVYHRKCVVRNALAVYYDFTYDESSSSADRYKDYIERIDLEFK